MALFLVLSRRLREALPPDSLRARLAGGAFWSLVGAIVSQALGLLASIVTARLLGKVGFGELGIILSTVGMFGVFAGLGLGLTATKHVAEFRTSAPARAGRIIGMSNLVAVLSGGTIATGLFFASPYLAVHTINAPHLTPELRIACVLLLFNALNGAQTGALAGFEAFKTIAKVNLLRGLLTFPLVVGGVWFWRLPGAVGAQAAAAAVAWLINHLALKREARKADVPIVYRDVRSELPLLWRFSLPAVLSGSMVGPVRWAANALLVNQPKGYAEMGIFNAATKFQAPLNLLGTTLGAALLPILASEDGSSSERFNRANVLFSWVLGVFAALPLICFPEIMQLFFGSDFGGESAIRTLVLVMGFSCIILYNQGLARVLAARSLMWWGFLSNTVWALILLGSFFGLKQWGAIGLAGSFTIAYVAHTAVQVPLCIWRHLVPKATMVSKEAMLVWTVIAALCSLTFLNYSFAVRLIAFLFGGVALGVAFARLLRAAPMVADQHNGAD